MTYRKKYKDPDSLTNLRETIGRASQAISYKKSMKSMGSRYLFITMGRLVGNIIIRISGFKYVYVIKLKTV